tara:strand:- start:655 stop:1293 length:639 start_codon:yes stop_codon:yes gene_type:complete
MNKNEKILQFIFEMRRSGVTNSSVLSIMEEMPREVFLSDSFKLRAYENTPIPFLFGQTISQPSIVGLMTQALNLTKKCKVLEIGTGSGYQTSILAKLSRRVYTIERFHKLSIKAEKLLNKLNINNVTFIKGDGSKGFQSQMPFDRIILTAASEDLPKILIKQLKNNGIMVLPVGQSDDIQKVIKIKKNDSRLEFEELIDVRFVPLIEGEVLE